MLNGRIYRAAWLPAFVAVVVAALSFGHWPGVLSTSLAPDAFNGPQAVQTLSSLAREFPDRRAGSLSDDHLAERIAQIIRGFSSAQNSGFQVRTHRFMGQTAEGERTLSTVLAERPGSTASSPIVILAHRDSTARKSLDGLSGTAVLLEIARVLSSRETNRTVILLSTSGGSGGDAGAAEFAADARRPIDAAIVIGDLGSSGTHAASVISYSEGLGGAPLQLTRTVAHAIAQESVKEPGSPGLGSQFAHLAFPLAVGEQGPLNTRGIAAVLVQAGGESEATPRAMMAPAQIESSGRAILGALGALDGGPDIPAGQETVLLLGANTIPSWAVRLLVGAMLLPLLLVALDAFARVRRRREPVVPWAGWALLCAAPFLFCALFVVLLGKIHAIGASPPAPVPARAVPLGSSAVAALTVTALLFVACWVGRIRISRRIGVGKPSEHAAAGVAVLLLLVATSGLVWLVNPFASALLVLATHLWLILASPEQRPRRVLSVPVLVLGLLPWALLLGYYAHQLGAGVLSGAWIVVLMLTGGHLGVLATAVASIFSGCVVALALIVLGGGTKVTGTAAVTIRGPISYAGPGSLGGTEPTLSR
jgi:hypothetical protein